jgi:purine-nucleoside phosphorylase
MNEWNPSDEMEKLRAAKAFLLERCPVFPKIVIVLGSGLGAALGSMPIEVEIPYAEIPHLKPASVEGHRGRLLIGKIGGVRIAAMQGRLHFYEGLSMADVVFPFRALALAGGDTFLLTNASGGLKTDMAPLDLMLIRDHINLMGTNPLIGRNLEELGPRFPDMTHVYDSELSEILVQAARQTGLRLREGVYVGIHGPSYETPSEIKMYQMLGGDAVGMSTVPEAIALRHMGKRVAGISCITNLAAGVSASLLAHAEVLENAKLVYTAFYKLLSEAVAAMGKRYG